MSKSLFNIITQVPGSSAIGMNVLAQDGGGKMALQVAIDAALRAGGTGAVLVNSAELQARPIDFTISAAVPPSTDAAPKAVYLVQFRPGSGPNQSNVGPMLIESWPQVTGGVTTASSDLAIQCAIAQAPQGSVPNAAIMVGIVDLDTTGA